MGICSQSNTKEIEVLSQNIMECLSDISLCWMTERSWMKEIEVLFQNIKECLSVLSLCCMTETS